MHFGNPLLLWALALVPVLAGLGWLGGQYRARAIERLGQSSLLGQLYPPSVRAWRANRLWLALLTLILLVISAARPQYGRIEQVVRRAGVDVLIALDVSPSMLAEDVKPNRLARAKESLQWLVHQLRGNRVGIIAFAGEAFLNCPMTLDLSLADLVLGALGPDSIGIPGTDLGKAIRTAKEAFERGGSGSPVLVLITDGEDNEGQGLAAAREAAQAGLRIFAIGIGTETGAPIPNGVAGYKETSDGSKVSSRMEFRTLEAVAKETGGAAIAAGQNPIAAIDIVVRRINSLEKQESESKRMVIYQDRYSWFLVPAVCCLIWLLLSRPEETIRRKSSANGGAYAS